MLASSIGLIHGWLTEAEGRLLYDLVEKSPGSVVEIGAWKGKSTAWLLVAADSFGKKLYTIDHFRGSSEHHEMYGPDIDTFPEFQQNISRIAIEFNITSIIHICKMTSEAAVKRFIDGSVGMVFIDGSHDYDSVRFDLDSWDPKVMKDGIIALHDSNYSSIEKAIRDHGYPKNAQRTDSIMWWIK